MEVTEFLCQVDISIAGMAVGSGSASGASFLNLWTWKRESASAIALSTPRICCSTSVKLCVAAVKNSDLTRCISDGCLDVPVHHMSTTAWLSQSTPGVGHNNYCIELLPLNIVFELLF